MRPIPDVVVAELSHPDYQVLRRTVVKTRVHGNKRARILGAPLSEGYTLFKDLQSIYKTEGTPQKNRPTSAPYVMPSTLEVLPGLHRDCHSLELHPLAIKSCDQMQVNDHEELIEETNATTANQDKLGTIFIEDSHSYHSLEHVSINKKRSFQGEYEFKNVKPNDTQTLLSAADDSDSEV